MPRLIKTTVEMEGRVSEQYALVEGDDLAPWAPDAELGIVGYPAPRVDGAARASGAACYTTDVRLPGMLYAAFVTSPHPHARLRAINTAAALAIPGVVGALTRGDVAAALRPGSRSSLGGDLALRFGDELRYAGEVVAVVAATDPDLAADGAAAVAVEYEPLPHLTAFTQALAPAAPEVHTGGNLFGGQRQIVERGDCALGFAEAAVAVEETYSTPTQVHSCLEPHGTVAVWEGDSLTVYEGTQHVYGARGLLADWLGLPQSRVRVLCPYVGGGFGSKAEPGVTSLYAALLARQLRRPVRVVYPRALEQLAGGARSATTITVRLGARRDGTLTAMAISCLGDLGAYAAWLPSFGAPGPLMYRCPHVRVENAGVFTHTGPFDSFRAPGYVEGTFAIESAMDELAAALEMDPLELRRRNIPAIDQGSGRPFSSYPVAQCYERGAARVGWPGGAPATGEGRYRRGLGVAGQIWGGGGGPPAYASVELNPDGSATLRTGSQDIGTGTRTVLAQVCAEELGLPLAAVQTVLGDSGAGPYAPISGGSKTVPSLAPAVRAAARDARLQLLDVAAQMSGVEAADLDVQGGVIMRGERRLASVRELTQRLGDAMIIGHGSRGPNPAGVAIVTSGAQFVEVEVDTLTGQVRVLRVVAAHDCGRIINPLTFRSQIEGGIIQGLGYALGEERLLDHNSGLVLNANLGEYRLPTIADVPAIDVVMLDIPDLAANSTGAKGAGEPPIIPTAPAVANAVAAAIGVRIRSLPLTPEKILAALAAGA